MIHTVLIEDGTVGKTRSESEEYPLIDAVKTIYLHDTNGMAITKKGRICEVLETNEA